MKESTFANFFLFHFISGEMLQSYWKLGCFYRSRKKANNYDSVRSGSGAEMQVAHLMPGPEVSIGEAPTLKLHMVSEGKRPCWLCRHTGPHRMPASHQLLPGLRH